MKNSFFLKMLTVYITIFLVFSSAVSFVVYLSGEQKSKIESEQRSKQTVMQAKERIDGRLSAAFSYTDDFFTDRRVADYFGFPEVDYYELVFIKDKLSRATASYSNFNFRIGISKVSDDIVIFPNETVELAAFLKECDIDGDMEKELWDFMTGDRLERTYVVGHTAESGKKTTTLIKRVLTNGRYKPVVFISFLNEHLLPPNVGDGCFVLREGARLIAFSSGGDEALLRDFARQKSAEDKFGIEISVFPLRGEGKTAYTVSSNLQPWQIDYIAGDDVSASGALWAAFLFVLLMAAGTFIAFSLTKRMYSPVKQVMGFIQGSGGRNEFDAIMGFINKLGLDKQFLLDEVRGNQKFLREKFIRDILMGTAHPDSLREQLERFDLMWLSGGVVPVLTEVRQNGGKEEPIYAEAFDRIAEGLKTRFVYAMVKWDYKSCVALIKCEDAEEVREFLLEYLASLEGEIKVRLLAIIGEFCDSFDQFPEMIRLIESMREHRFYHSRKLAVTASEFREYRQIYYPFDIDKAIINEIAEGHPQKGREIFKYVLEENLIKRNISEDMLQQFVFSVITTLNRILRQTDSSPVDVFGEDVILFAELKMCEANGALYEKCMEFFDKIIKNVDIKTKREDDELSKKLVEFLHENYMRDISRDDLATHFGLSADYIGLLFKQKVGNNYKDYLSIYRIRKAAEMLAESDLTVKEISQRSGFNDVRNFRKVFKRYEGIAPDEYRSLKRR